MGNSPETQSFEIVIPLPYWTVEKVQSVKLVGPAGDFHLFFCGMGGVVDVLLISLAIQIEQQNPDMTWSMKSWWLHDGILKFHSLWHNLYITRQFAICHQQILSDLCFGTPQELSRPKTKGAHGEHISWRITFLQKVVNWHMPSQKTSPKPVGHVPGWNPSLDTWWIVQRRVKDGPPQKKRWPKQIPKWIPILFVTLFGGRAGKGSQIRNRQSFI